MQKEKVPPAAPVRISEPEETLPTVKQVFPSGVSGKPESSGRAPSQEIETHERVQMDTTPIEVE